MDFNDSTVIQKFWSKVIRRGDNECWGWRGSVLDKRYGRYCGIGAHRISYQLHHGPIPEGMVVMHRCDNGFCVNPAHLMVGTDKDNMRDKYEKGRDNVAVLSPQHAQQAKHLKEAGMTYREIGALFGVAHNVIFYIVTGARYGWCV